MEREYIVTCKTREDLESLYEDLETPGGSLYIPDRAVECIHKRPTSRNTHYSLTDEEATLLKNDERVLDVELTPEELGIVFKPAYTIESRESALETTESPQYTESTNRWSKTTNVQPSFRNWGLIRCVNGDTFPNWGSGTGELTNITNTTTTYTVRVTGSGKNVDVVVVDGCINPAHPEFAVDVDGSGGSRVNQYNWLQHRLEVEGTSNGTYVYTPYIDAGNNSRTADNNHGMHVSGIVAGNTQGWARDANIYNINLYSTAPTVINSSFLFDYVRAWHNSKPVNPDTGKKNPTIANNSWGSYYTFVLADVSAINYRGTTITQPGGGWDQSTLESYGIMGYFIDTQDNNTPKIQIPANTSALQADVNDCVDDGIIFVAAAGNDEYKSTISGDVDYNNYITVNSFSIYYHRGGQPNGLDNVISVGNISSLAEESKVGSSTCGNRVDIYAPGDRIMSCVHNNVVDGGTVQVNSDSRPGGYQVAKYGGTSMATPQVAGSLACLLEIWPRMSPAEAIDWVKNYGRTLNQITDYGSTTTSWNVVNNGSTSYTFSGASSGSNIAITATEGDILEFNVNVGIHNFWIKTTETTGTGDGVTTGTITNNGQGNTGTVTWDTRGVTPGTYYYICQLHFSMKGTITILPDYTRSNSLQGSENKYLHHINQRLVTDPPNSTNQVGGTTTKQITFPRGKHKQRGLSGTVYPRVDVWNRG